MRKLMQVMVAMLALAVAAGAAQAAGNPVLDRVIESGREATAEPPGGGN